MAYAAQILEQQITLCDGYPVILEKDMLACLKGNVSIILTFLEEYSSKCIEVVNLLENRIIDVAYQAEDIIEPYSSSPSLSESRIAGDHSSSKKFESKNMIHQAKSVVTNLEMECQDLQKVLQEVDFILEEVMKIKKNCTAEDMRLVGDYAPATLSSRSSRVKTTLVGCEDNFMEIRARIYEQSPQLLTIPIYGMGGIGKTSLAKRVYEDSINAQYFDRFVWVVVSQKYSIRNILLGVVSTINKLNDELAEKSDGELAEIVYKELIGRRYLIVVDDVWSTKAWDDVKRIFPNDGSGSRILLTTRLADVATYAGSSISQPPHEMHFLNEDQSWCLHKEKVFTQEPCPFHLNQVGKRIAKTCQGLPLTIVVVAGILKEKTTAEYWESVSENISSAEPTIARNCSKILSFSYDSLPSYLKPCFLYATAFPEDSEIHVNRLVKLWVAEGLAKPSALKLLEEVAEGYLDDLVKRSLLIVTKKRSNGGIKSVRMHDLLRDIGKIKAQEKRFLYYGLSESMNGTQRRLSITYDSFHSLPYIYDPTTRSLVISLSNFFELLSSILNFRLLRILDALDLVSKDFPDEMLELIHLRYLAFTYYSTKLHKLPTSISNLQNLQTLIIRFRSEHKPNNKFFLPREIGKMPRLRHLILSGPCHLKNPAGLEILGETNLQTLSLVTSFSLTEEAVQMLENLRRLGLRYFVIHRGDGAKFFLNNLVHLSKLEILKIMFQYSASGSKGWMWSDVVPVKLAFPLSLKKLTLSDCRIPWEDMTIIGSLPNLEVLKLKGRAFTGRKWNPIEGEFDRLKHLQFSGLDLRHWGADSMHFPSLERLVLKDGLYLKELPSGIGEILPLQLIELHHCLESIVASAKQIQEDQRDMGNDALEVLVYS